jgi:hypothetical protein
MKVLDQMRDMSLKKHHMILTGEREERQGRLGGMFF